MEERDLNELSKLELDLEIERARDDQIKVLSDGVKMLVRSVMNDREKLDDFARIVMDFMESQKGGKNASDEIAALFSTMDKAVDGFRKLIVDSFSAARIYVTTVIFASFAGFFLFWSHMRTVASTDVLTWSGFLMTISVGVFVTCEFLTALRVSFLMRKLAKATEPTSDDLKARLKHVQDMIERLGNPANAIWKVYVFEVVASLLPAVVAGLLLAWSFLQHVLP